MKRFRVGPYASLIEDMGYVIQEKVWWGWKNFCHYASSEAALADARKLEKRGYWVDYYI